MTREELYLELGCIDDDLIQEAAVSFRRKKSVLYAAIGIAACVCLIVGCLLPQFQKDFIYFNNVSVPTATKIKVSGDDIISVSMSIQELFSYYGLEQLPDTLGALKSNDLSYYVLHKDSAGNILYDTNFFYYSSSDHLQTASIALTKKNTSQRTFEKAVKYSEIDNTPVLLATSSTFYWAEFRLHDTSIQITTDGLCEEEFLSIVTSLIRHLK